MNIDSRPLIDAELVSVKPPRGSVSVDVELRFGKAHYRKKINQESMKITV